MSNIMGIEFSDETLKETTDRISKIIDEDYSNLVHVITANPEIAMKIMNNKEMKKIADEAGIITPDGIGIVYASKLLGGEVKERVSGFDLLVSILEKRKREAKSVRIYALGASKETIELTVKNIQNTYPYVNIVGYQDGYYKPEDETKIVKEISECQPDLLLVAMGCPRQEQFIYRHKPYLKSKVAIGVGGSFDVLSGKTKRAPELIQKMNLEWFYRLVSDPKRIKRQLSLFVFGFKVLAASLKQK